MKVKLIRMLMEQAGTPTDAGGAGTPAPTVDPAPAPAADPKPAADPAPTADPKPADADPKPATDAKKSLLGGAQEDASKANPNGSAEPNPDGGKKPGDGQQQDTPQDPYKDLSLPDGAVVDEKEMASYKNLAKELNLTPESAQAILDFEAKRLSAGAAAAATAWQEQVKQEHGDKLPIVMATCAKAINQFGGDELRTLLDQTGLGNHPILVRAFYQAGSLLKEDRQAGSSGGAKADVTFAQALYGNHSK